jgi:hypothetical protein
MTLFITLIFNLFLSPPGLASDLPQGKFEGKIVVGGDGFGGIRTDKSCTLEIEGKSAKSSFTGSRSFPLERIPEERGLFMGASGDKGFFVVINRDKTVAMFGTKTLVMGEPIDTEEDQLCAVNIR